MTDRVPRILAFGGSLRRQSYNHFLAAFAAEAARRAGAEVTLIRLTDHPLPLYDADYEDREGLPESARRLKQLFLSHDGLLVASPEYNSSLTAALKNALDWVSRREDGEEPLAAFRGKAAGLLAASPGGLGGLRGLVHLRAILGNLGVLVLPRQHAVSAAADAFDSGGALTSERDRQGAAAVAEDLVSLLRRLG